MADKQPEKMKNLDDDDDDENLQFWCNIAAFLLNVTVKKGIY